jgi:hypothetical protein
VIPLGGILAACGLAMLLVAKPLHDNWREMNRETRAAGLGSVWGAEWLASDAGLRTVRRVGGVLLAVGLGMVAAGLLGLGG